MLRLIFSPAARADLLAIEQYIYTQTGPKTSAQFIHRLIEVCESLCRLPNRTRKRPELGENLHSKPVGSYVIIIRVGTKKIEIVRILHSRRRTTPGTLV